MKRPWVTLFSQTGSEIFNLIKTLNRVPDFIITNKTKDKFLEIKPELFDEFHDKFIWLPKKPTVEEYKNVIPSRSLVTLHGWLRIIPPEICDLYEIYNLHPAPLVTYPHLKGKDPQVRTFEEKLKYSGNTIHKCIAELDAGPILAQNIVDIKNNTLDEIFTKTHKAASELWVDFLRYRL
jgi:hypothetical protein